MNRSTERPTNYNQYRARPPKRRKVNGAEHQPRYTELTQSDPPSDEGWPARTILKERGTGKKREYEVDWVGVDPKTGQPYQPTWEPRKHINEALLLEWDRKQRARHLAKDGDFTPSDSQPSFYPTAHPSHSRSHGTKASRTLRRKRIGRMIDDSSSDIESSAVQHYPNIHEGTPTLDSDTASTPIEDFGPGSPLATLEILESQHPPAAPADFSLAIPPVNFDREDYESYHGSQIPYSFTSPVNTFKSPPSAASASSRKSLPSFSQPNRPVVSSPLSQSKPRFSSRTHLNLQKAVRTSAPPSLHSSRSKLQIPASSETTHLSTLSTTSQIIESSLPSKPSKLGQRDPSLEPHGPPSTRGTSSNRLLSSAQQPPQVPVVENATLSPSLRTLAPSSQIDSFESSQLWKFQTQAVPLTVTQSQSKLAKAGRQTPKTTRLKASYSVTILNPSQQLHPRMDLPAVRQSPRLRASSPVKSVQSPQPVSQEQTHRTRTPQRDNGAAFSVLDSSGELQHTQLKPAPASSFASAQPYAQDSSDSVDTSPQQRLFDPQYGSSALPIQQSIEEEPPSSAEDTSIASKASSSQASLDNERVIPQVDGISLPLQPVLGPAEYTVALPAEGKIQSAYDDTIKAKRKTILRFINRRESVGSANGSTARTKERNEMIELIDRLHDTTTHFDLGLPGFATQYLVHSEEQAAFARYAGAKFAFLDCLVDALVNVDTTIIIASKPGAVQQLIEDFLRAKHVHVTRHDRPSSARSRTPDYHQKTLKVDLVDTTSDNDLRVSGRWMLLIAFDTSFDNQSPQIRRIRELNSRGRNQLLPVVHLLTSNSSEHIDRCLRKAMPSPQRLKLLVRGTYQAKANLGGQPTYVPDLSDGPEDSQMSLDELQRAVRKSPNRKLRMIAHIIAQAVVAEDFEQYWSLGPMPEVQYDDLEDTPPKLSERSTTVGTAAATPRDGRARSRTPLSRAGTPSGKKRLLDPDDIRIQSILSKRQRMSPLRDMTPAQESPKEQVSEVVQLRELVKSLQAELSTEKLARSKAEADLDREKTRSAVWETSHNTLMQRFDTERRKRQKLTKEKKQIQVEIDSGKEKLEKGAQTNANLKEQVAQLKKDLNTVREELSSSSVPELVAIETARSEARVATAKATSLEKQLQNRNTDFEYTRQNYQEASNRAVELASQNTELEAQVEVLKGQASEEKRRLRLIALDNATKGDRRRIDQLEAEKKVIEKLLKKTREEVEVLRKGRGVQTRGSSVQPPGSPAMGMVVGAAVGTRSRQNSPAPHVMGSAADARRDAAAHRELGHGGVANNRISGLRNER